MMLLSSRFLFYKPNATVIPSLAAVVALVLFTISFYYSDNITLTWNARASTGLSDWVLAWGGTQGSTPDLSKKLVSLLNAYSPTKAETVDAVTGPKVNRWFATGEDDRELMDILNVTSQQILIMKEAHGGFVKAIEEELPRHPSTSQNSTNGIVTVGGGSYFPPLLVSLRLLRRTGTNLPVEVFLPKDEYEPELCEQVLPRLHGSCRTLDHFNGRISHYQYKVFAILLSSFTDLLWLDADNFPLHDVAPLFTSTPFQRTGLVTWPDLWQTSVSPAYYEISSRSPTPVSARASTESGQLLVSKEKHRKTLLLVAYYNYYGPGYYYPLLCQGKAGAGDKETFLPAAEALGLPFYDVKAPALEIGHFRNNEHHEEGLYRFALIQRDLLSDYAMTLELEEAGSGVDTTSDAVDATRNPIGSKRRIPQLSSYDEVPPLFLHMMTPKWDARLVLDHVGKYDFTLDADRHPSAAFIDPPETSARIEGVERMVWEEARWVACHLEGAISIWKGKARNGVICRRLEEYFRDVLDTEKGNELGLGADTVPAPHAP